MNESDQSDSLSASETPLIGKLTPRLLRTLSSETNLQTMTLGGPAESDSLATMSLSEIGGIPQGGTGAPLDPNLLIGLSPETLSMMSAGPFQFLPTMTSQNDLDPMATIAAKPPPTDGDTMTTDARTHPIITSCLSAYASNRTRISRKGSKGSEASEGICGEHGVVTIMDSAIVGRLPAAAAAHLRCGPTDDRDVVVNSQDALVPNALVPNTLVPNALVPNTLVPNALVPNGSGTLTLFGGADLNGNSVGSPPRLEDESDGRVCSYLSEGRPGTPPGSLSRVVSVGSVSRPVATRKKLVCTSHSLVDLSNAVEAVSENCAAAPPASHGPECPQGHSSSLLSPSENSVQYVSITVPNVEINSSGQLVISHISLLQAPHQSSSYIPLVTQSVETPVISQIVAPDSTSEGLPPKLVKRKGGWPKGKKRKVNPVEATHVPKGPTTSYMIFFRENRHKIQEENPSLSFKELLKEISLRWAGITKDEKKRYKEKAAKQKKRYLSEVKTHSQTEAYQVLIRKETEKKLGGPDDFAANDVFLIAGDLSLMEEDPLNPNELYCKVCDQYFNSIHNKKEHLSGRQHIKTVGEKLYSYSQQQPPPHGPEPVSVVTLDDSMKKDLTNVDGIRVDIMELHAEREIEIKNLRREAAVTVLRNAQLNKELKDLQDTCEKLGSDLKNLKSIDASLQTKLNSLRILMTLFGVLNFS